ncbi:flagellar basal body-associated protein FliL [Sulfitobacter sp. HNIBRBA2951]|uniref:flagellar basal body-associated protein FliL n=1 Tax=Sulfitobacter aquimarinus TaxID=3158557 RepID=UPI0032E00142
MKKLLPLILLIIGAGAGVGAGVFLRPEPVAEVADANAEEGVEEAAKEEKEHKKDDHAEEGEVTKEELTHEFVKLNNQFVVPIVVNEKVAALVVLALSLEVPAGETDNVYLREPKLRDSFLQVLFDHANMGGFEGNFTNAKVLDQLRAALVEVAQRDLGKDMAKDVLIIEIARQDY